MAHSIPYHMGHLALAIIYVNIMELDEIWFLISPPNPLKQQTDLWDDNHGGTGKTGIAAVIPNSGFDFEFHCTVNLPYTIHTLDALHKPTPNEFRASSGGRHGFGLPR